MKINSKVDTVPKFKNPDESFIKWEEEKCRTFFILSRTGINLHAVDYWMDEKKYDI